MLPTAEFHIWVPVAVTVATGMEPWAAFVHHKVWHGPLWGVHESHHVERVGYFEKNDIFAALHALPAMALIVGSSYTAWQPLAALMFGFGLGMTIFGCAYAVIHDGLIHERLPIQFLLRFRVCLLYTSPSPRDVEESRMPSSA